MMRSIGITVALLVGAVAMGVTAAYGHEVAVLDDCDPTSNPPWSGAGCALKKGEVDVNEFNALLPPGHPA
jgi:hypothetical protein